MSKKDFNVIIMHGHSQEYLKVIGLVEKEKYTPIVLKEKYTGELILEKIRNNIWDRAHCAIVIMSPDDVVGEDLFRARQNVIFELGYCLAAFDNIPDKYWYNAVIVIKEQSVEKFADIGGLEYISYTKEITSENLKNIADALKTTFKKARKFYYEL